MGVGASFLLGDDLELPPAIVLLLAQSYIGDRRSQVVDCN